MEEGFNFKKLVQKLVEIKNLLLSKWKVLLLFITIGGLVGGAIGYFSTLRFTATSSVLIGGSRGGVGGALKMAQSLGLGSIGGGDAMAFNTDNAKEIITSKRIITNALLSEIEVDKKKDKLVNFYIEWFGLRKKWQESKKGLENFKFTSQKAFHLTFKEDSIIQGIYNSLIGKNLLVTGDLKTSIVEMKVVSEKEIFAYHFSQELLKSVGHFYIDESVAKERKSFENMQQKTDSIYSELLSKERTLAVLKDNSFRTQKLQGMVSQYQLQREVEILNVLYASAVKNLEMTKVSLMEKQPVFQVIDEPVLPLVKKKTPTVQTAIIVSVLFAFFYIVVLLIKGAIRKALNS